MTPAVTVKEETDRRGQDFLMVDFHLAKSVGAHFSPRIGDVETVLSQEQSTAKWIRNGLFDFTQITAIIESVSTKMEGSVEPEHSRFLGRPARTTFSFDGFRRYFPIRTWA